MLEADDAAKQKLIPFCSLSRINIYIKCHVIDHFYLDLHSQDNLQSEIYCIHTPSVDSPARWPWLAAAAYVLSGVLSLVARKTQTWAITTGSPML